MKIVVCPDSFKGSLTAAQASEAIKEGISSVCPDYHMVTLPLADGGEGTSSVIASITGGTAIVTDTINAIGENITATYYIINRGKKKTALIDVAAASGLTLVSPQRRDVMTASSYGTGVLIKNAYERGCRDFIIGLGGSATCDAGTGIMEALGPDIPAIASDISVTLLCDVDNPLYGPKGAANVFAPQKGATPRQVALLDERLRQWNIKTILDTGRNVAGQHGAGAAGGIGAMFMAYFNTTTKAGIDAVLDMYGFDSVIADADLVITGEGCIDSQTLHGKVGMGVLRRCNVHRVPVIAMGGSVEYGDLPDNAGFTAVFSIVPGIMTLEQAVDATEARRNLAETSRQIIRIIRSRL